MIGPYTVTSFGETSKNVVVQKNSDSAIELCNITQVKPFLEPMNPSAKFARTMHQSFAMFKPNIEPWHVQITEVIGNGDPRASSPKMRATIVRAVADLLRRDTFRVTRNTGVPGDANILTASFVLAIKSEANGEIMYKSQ